MKISDTSCLLTSTQIQLLVDSASINFPIGGYSSLDNILTALDVEVIIESGIPTRIVPDALMDAFKELTKREMYIRTLIERYEHEIEDARKKYDALARHIGCENEDYIKDDKFYEIRLHKKLREQEALKGELKHLTEHIEEMNIRIKVEKEEYGKIRERIGSLDHEREMKMWSEMPLRGLYDPSRNIIKLFPDEMQTEYHGTRMDELLVSTLAHETMHAYFNRPQHKNFLYIVHVEEPLAEFGMLLYLYESQSNYYNWAYQDVSRKRTCYRYGANLMGQHLAAGTASTLRPYLEAYKIRLDYNDMPAISPADGSIIMPKSGRHASSITKHASSEGQTP